jgi:hypothetical protein
MRNACINAKPRPRREETMRTAALSLLLALASVGMDARAAQPETGEAPAVLAASPANGASRAMPRRLMPDIDPSGRLEQPVVTAVPRAVIVAVPLQPFAPSPPGGAASLAASIPPGSGVLAALAMVAWIVIRRRD